MLRLLTIFLLFWGIWVKQSYPAHAHLTVHEQIYRHKMRKFGNVLIGAAAVLVVYQLYNWYYERYSKHYKANMINYNEYEECNVCDQSIARVKRRQGVPNNERGMKIINDELYACNVCSDICDDNIKLLRMEGATNDELNNETLRCVDTWYNRTVLERERQAHKALLRGKLYKTQKIVGEFGGGPVYGTNPYPSVPETEL